MNGNSSNLTDLDRLVGRCLRKDPAKGSDLAIGLLVRGGVFSDEPSAAVAVDESMERLRALTKAQFLSFIGEPQPQPRPRPQPQPQPEPSPQKTTSRKSRAKPKPDSGALSHQEGERPAETSDDADLRHEAGSAGIAQVPARPPAADLVRPSSDEPADPFDLEALRSAPLVDLEVEKVLTHVPVRKPGRTEFFRVHPGDDYTIDSLLLEHVDSGDRVMYWIAPGLRAELADEARAVRLYTCITKGRTVFLWPAKLPRDDSNSGRAWAESALQGAETAKELWVKLVGNRELGAYEIFKAMVTSASRSGPISPSGS